MHNNTCLTAEQCLFKNLTLVPGPGEAAAGSALYALNGAGLLLVVSLPSPTSHLAPPQPHHDCRVANGSACAGACMRYIQC